MGSLLISEDRVAYLNQPMHRRSVELFIRQIEVDHVAATGGCC